MTPEQATKIIYDLEVIRVILVSAYLTFLFYAFYRAFLRGD